LFKLNKNISWYLLLSVCLSFSIKASPWIGTDDVYLRSDLQILADAGLITVPVNTFPLPWRAISVQLKQTVSADLSNYVNLAYRHVMYKLNAAKNNYGNSKLEIEAAQESIPSSFGSNNDIEWGITSSSEYDAPLFSIRATANYAKYHDKDTLQYNFDDSYFAVTTGKTNFFIDTQSQWWSPSWLQSLSAEQRVHPSYELGLERTFINIPVLGDAYFKTGINKLRSSDDWEYYWRSRLALKPFKSLELSISHFDFKNAQYDVEDDAQELSVDGRLSLFPLIELPLGFYAQYMIDDSESDYNDSLLGSDYSFVAKNTQIRVIFEYSDTDNDTDEYGHRYSIGSYVQMKNDHQWQIFLHHHDTDILKNQLVGAYRFLVYKGMLSLSLLLSDSDQSDKINTGISWELRF